MTDDDRLRYIVENRDVLRYLHDLIDCPEWRTSGIDQVVLLRSAIDVQAKLFPTETAI